MNILVTGATGFTGTALTQRLVKGGHCVRIIVRNQNKVEPELANKLEVIQGSITDENIVKGALEGIEAVIHTAAVYREPGLTDNVYWDVHVKATENLLKYSLKTGVKRFVHVSTGGVHGHIENPPANEDYRFAPGDIYQRTKLEGEIKAREFSRNTVLPVVIIRPSPIYGPGDMRLLKLFKLAKMKYTLLPGKGEIFYHMVYIDDLIDAFILALEKDSAIGETFIIGGNETLSLNQLLDLISDTLNYTKSKVHLPTLPFKIAGIICEKICIPFKIDPPIYPRRVDFFTKSRSFNIDKAKKILGYNPHMSLAEGIRKTADWYIHKKFL